MKFTLNQKLMPLDIHLNRRFSNFYHRYSTFECNDSNVCRAKTEALQQWKINNKDYLVEVMSTSTIWCQVEYKVCPHSVALIHASNWFCIGSSTKQVVFKMTTSSIETNGSISTPSHWSTFIREDSKTLCAICNDYTLIWVGLQNWILDFTVISRGCNQKSTTETAVLHKPYRHQTDTQVHPSIQLQASMILQNSVQTADECIYSLMTYILCWYYVLHRTLFPMDVDHCQPRMVPQCRWMMLN